jgi:GTPase SAR1 family protein
MEREIILATVAAAGSVVGAILGAILTSLALWLYTRTDIGQKNFILERLLNNHKEKIDELTSKMTLFQREVKRLGSFETKYNLVKSRLKASSVVRDYYQPVILVGPKFVGKSSLLAQWHTPWNHSRLKATQTHNISTVPIYDFRQSKVEPHFADSEILTDVHIHLKLNVHDFPGELAAQKSIVKQAVDETSNLRQKTNKPLGVVLICILNAEEAANTTLSQKTIDYYNGDLFSNLRTLVSHNQVGIERLILVFNKYDLLKEKYPNNDDKFLLNKCLEFFETVISPLRGTCNPEKVCEVFTVLSRGEDVIPNSRGASIVMGEAARNFVNSMAGDEAVKEVVKENATTYSARFF